MGMIVVFPVAFAVLKERPWIDPSLLLVIIDHPDPILAPPYSSKKATGVHTISNFPSRVTGEISARSLNAILFPRVNAVLKFRNGTLIISATLSLASNGHAIATLIFVEYFTFDFSFEPSSAAERVARISTATIIDAISFFINSP